MDGKQYQLKIEIGNAQGTRKIIQFEIKIFEGIDKLELNYNWDNSKYGRTLFDKHPDCVHRCNLAKRDYPTFEMCCGGNCSI